LAGLTVLLLLWRRGGAGDHALRPVHSITPVPSIAAVPFQSAHPEHAVEPLATPAQPALRVSPLPPRPASAPYWLGARCAPGVPGMWPPSEHAAPLRDDTGLRCGWLPASLGGGEGPRQCCCVEVACRWDAESTTTPTDPADAPPAKACTLPPGSCLPGIVIAGSQKAGTTALTGMLLAHSGVAPAAEKEVHFFDSKPQRDGGAQELVAEYLLSFPPPSGGAEGDGRDQRWAGTCQRRWLGGEAGASTPADASVVAWVTAAYQFPSPLAAAATLCTLRMEATPAYVTKPTLPARLGAALPRDTLPPGWDGGAGGGRSAAWGGTTVVITLRDPTDRAISE
jgi:hypothetical protein